MNEGSGWPEGGHAPLSLFFEENTDSYQQGVEIPEAGKPEDEVRVWDNLYWTRVYGGMQPEEARKFADDAIATWHAARRGK